MAIKNEKLRKTLRTTGMVLYFLLTVFVKFVGLASNKTMEFKKFMHDEQHNMNRRKK